MIFVVAGGNRNRLADLTKILISSFPGSTIYQHIDPQRVSKDVFHHNVNGVFLDAEMGSCNGIDLMWKLRKQKWDVPVYILSENEDFRVTAAKAGADGYFVYPLAEDAIRNALLSQPCRG